jgi:thiamine biosynthesis lipoprotein
MTSTSWRALGTTAALVVTEDSTLENAHAAVSAELAAIDRTCSRFREDSELVRLNAAGGVTTDVSPLLLEALATALDAASVTSGLVDPTIGRTLRLAGYDKTFAVVPERDGTVRPSFVRDPDWRSIELDRQRGTVRIPKGIELDLGATAKALAADRAASAAYETTGTGVLVSLGGDMAVAGEPPAGGWPIRLAEDHAEALDVVGPAVRMSEGGLATSATTIRRWTTSVGELHHIVDPRTGRSASTYWRSVSVAASSCVGANSASTAAIVLGEMAMSWLADLRLPARLVRYDKAVRYVAGWPADAV